MQCGCVESKGFCHYKCANGIKRHLAVDTLGFPFFTHCTKANVSDDQGLIEMLSHNLDYFRAKPVNPREDYHPARQWRFTSEKITAATDKNSIPRS